MAHHGEAQGVIETFKLKKISQDIFQGENVFLLLTGEGPFEASTKTALAISRYNIQSVLNAGIAGTLSDEFKIHDVVMVRSLYLVNGHHTHFKTFQTHQDGVDCITSFDRILHKDSAQKLKGVGHIVDREAWGVAMAAKTAGIPFKAIKVISDHAGSIEACELIKDAAPVFSDILVQKIIEILNEKLPAKEDLPKFPGLHFTFSTGHRFNTLLNKIMIKDETSKEEAISRLGLEAITNNELTPKERTRRLLDKMDCLIDPVKSHMQQTTNTLTKRFKESGLNISFDQTWENPQVTISLEVSSDEELSNKIDSLKVLSIKPFSDLMEGKLHVE